MAIGRGRARGHAPRTEAYRAHEELGFALGRLCVEAPAIRDAVHAGFTRALRVYVAGAAGIDVGAAARELDAAGDAVAAAHGVAVSKPSKPTKRPRGRARARAR